MIDSRFMKVKTLSQIYAREKTTESLEELQEEMRSMQHMDNTFHPIIEAFKLDGKYNSDSINFECLRPVIENLEEKCGRISDYGLIYIKYIAQACESISVEEISNHIRC